MSYLDDEHEQCDWTQEQCQHVVDETREVCLAAGMSAAMPYPQPLYRITGPFGASRLFSQNTLLFQCAIPNRRYESRRNDIVAGVGGGSFSTLVGGVSVPAYDRPGELERGGEYNIRGQRYDIARDGSAGKRYAASPNPTSAALTAELLALQSVLDSVGDGDTDALDAVLTDPAYTNMSDQDCAAQMYSTRCCMTDFQVVSRFAY